MMDGDTLAAAVRDQLGRAKGLEEKRMFGGTGFMLKGNLLAAASGRGLLLRVGEAGAKAALRSKGVRPMVMRGRTMRDYVYIDPSALTPASVAAGLRLALDFVVALPSKAARASEKGGAKRAKPRTAPKSTRSGARRGS